ncbi:MAG TPA: hypothetical protein VLL75_22715, partial [Vicinamibacteria bacterium]|nr:hypothetical protein [Vicinamibacteria bacterium]
RNADNGFRIVASVEAKAAPTAAPAATRGATGRAKPAEGSGGSALAGLAILLGLGALCGGAPLLALVFFLRRRRGVRTRIGEDGFTLVVPGARAGQRLHYRYRAGGVVKTGQTTITGDPREGVFVYTGERPSAVELLSAAAAAVPPPRPAASTVAPVYREPDEPFRGFPSAY